MGRWDEYIPAIAMVAVEIAGATTTLLNRACLVTGMSPMVLTVYRQGIAALFTFTIGCFTRGRSSRSKAKMGIKSFLLIFIAAFIGVVLCQLLYYQGLYMTSSSIGTASANLTPAITFIIAVVLGMEHMNIRKLSSIAKIIGTILCVGGAICMALLRGPKILNLQFPTSFANILVLESSESDKNWILGCFYLFACKSCWAIWLIMQVPILRCYPDTLSLSTWISFIGMLQAAVIAVVTDADPESWKLSSALELISYLFSGIVGSGATFFVISWCIKKRGPFFSSVFCPLSTIIATGFSCILLHEELYIGSLLGAVAVIIGLYIVLWGKSEETKVISFTKLEESQVQEYTKFEDDLEEPLLTNAPHNKTDQVA